jgi:glycosyltransferase involved in cell wall biosynthesis
MNSSLSQTDEFFGVRVSVLLPVYNGSRFVSHAIESVLKQTYQNIELIIVNDGSQDDCAAIIRPYLADQRIKYIEQANSGVAAARNTAFSLVSGKYIAFIDQDDIWLPNKLERQVAYLEAHPEIAMAHARQCYIDEAGNPIESNSDHVEPVNGNCFRELFEKNCIAVLTVLARQSAIEEAGGFNRAASCSDDYEMWLKISWKHLIGFQDEIVAAYRIHKNNESLNSFKMTQADLVVMESVLSAYPEAKKALGSLWRSRLFDFNAQLSAWYSWKYNDYASARKHLLKALKAKPFSLLCWRKLIWLSLSIEQRSRILWWRYRFVSIMFRQ